MFLVIQSQALIVSPLQSGLAAGVAAQLYTFFNDTASYPQDANCAWMGHAGRSCRERIGYMCYLAILSNIGAATSAFIVMDWQKDARRHIPEDATFGKRWQKFVKIVLPLATSMCKLKSPCTIY